eukprot:scaffold238404_cov30-Tisochrysis_lutea.AAC.4
MVCTRLPTDILCITSALSSSFGASKSSVVLRILATHFPWCRKYIVGGGSSPASSSESAVARKKRQPSRLKPPSDLSTKVIEAGSTVAAAFCFSVGGCSLLPLPVHSLPSLELPPTPLSLPLSPSLSSLVLPPSTPFSLPFRLSSLFSSPPHNI